MWRDKDWLSPNSSVQLRNAPNAAGVIAGAFVAEVKSRSIVMLFRIAPALFCFYMALIQSTNGRAADLGCARSAPIALASHQLLHHRAPASLAKQGRDDVTTAYSTA